MLRALLIVAAVAALAAAGVVEGLRSNRWGESVDARAAAAKLDKVPLTFGDWTGTDIPLDDKIVRVAEATGYVQRAYRNGKTGAAVSVLLLCGPPGPIASHTPDVCYAGNGYAMTGTPTRRPVAGATCWAVRFTKDGPGEVPLEVYWAWGTDGTWEAADDPRWAFASKSVLYKLYATRAVPPAPPDGPPPADPLPAFLAAFLPVVKTALGPDPK